MPGKARAGGFPWQLRLLGSGLIAAVLERLLPWESSGSELTGLNWLPSELASAIWETDCSQPPLPFLWPRAD